MDNGEFVVGLMAGAVVAAVIFIIIVGSSTTFKISQETADDICRQLTGNESAVGEDTYNDGIRRNSGKLICVTPSYDATQNIVFKQNNE